MGSLDDWLKICWLTPADFGRNLGLKWPYSVRRYLRTDANGRPRKDWRAPRPDIQLKIERMTRGCVTRADWAKEVARRAGATINAQSDTHRSLPSRARTSGGLSKK